MPTAVNFKGVFSRRPGVYADVDTSALEVGVTTTNRMAIVADMPFLQQGVTKTLTSQGALLKVEPTSKFLQDVAKIVFNPANDPNVTGSPAAITLVSPNPSTQAKRTLTCGSVNNLDVKARSFGTFGNTIAVRVQNNASDSALRDILIKKGSEVEKFNAVGTGNVFTAQYTASEATTVTGEYARATGLTIKSTVADTTSSLDVTGGGNSVTYAITDATDVAIKGTVKISLTKVAGSNLGASDNALTATIVGTNLAGAATTENVVFDDASVLTKTSTNSFATITSVAIALGSGLSGSTRYQADVEFSYVVNASEHSTIQSAIDEINGLSSKGYGASVVQPFYTSSVNFNKMDLLTGTDMKSGTLGFKADLQEYVRIIDTFSALCSAAEVTAAGGGALDQTSGVVSGDETTGLVFLTGGSQTAEASLTSTNWATAIDALRPAIDPVSQEAIDVQTIVLFNTDEDVQKDLRAHCIYMAGAGKNECNGWVAMPTEQSLSTIRTRSKALNTRHLALVFQDVTITAADGSNKKLDPRYLALMLASIQNSTATGVPQTSKLINALKVHQASGLNLMDSIEDLLESSVVTIMPSQLGYKVERSLTTLQSDNQAFNEVSGNESINTSIRDLRTGLDQKIGQPNVATTLASVTSIVKSRLRDQVVGGTIKAINEGSVEAVDQGDSILIRYTAAPTLPINFIKIEASFVATI